MKQNLKNIWKQNVVKIIHNMKSYRQKIVEEKKWKAKGNKNVHGRSKNYEDNSNFGMIQKLRTNVIE